MRKLKELGFTENRLLFGYKTEHSWFDHEGWCHVSTWQRHFFCPSQSWWLSADHCKSQMLLHTCEYIISNTQVFYQRISDKALLITSVYISKAKWPVVGKVIFLNKQYKIQNFFSILINCCQQKFIRTIMWYYCNN